MCKNFLIYKELTPINGHQMLIMKWHKSGSVVREERSRIKKGVMSGEKGVRDSGVGWVGENSIVPHILHGLMRRCRRSCDSLAPKGMCIWNHYHHWTPWNKWIILGIFFTSFIFFPLCFIYFWCFQVIVKFDGFFLTDMYKCVYKYIYVNINLYSCMYMCVYLNMYACV